MIHNHLQALLVDADHHPGLLALHAEAHVQGALVLLGLPAPPQPTVPVGGQGEGRREGEGQAGASGGGSRPGVRAGVAEDGHLRREHALQGVQHVCKSRGRGETQVFKGEATQASVGVKAARTETETLSRLEWYRDQDKTKTVYINNKKSQLNRTNDQYLFELIFFFASTLMEQLHFFSASYLLITFFNVFLLFGKKKESNS